MIKAKGKMTEDASYREQLNQVVDLLKKSSNVLFITGAGISAESGLPTYRGIGGLYEDQLTKDNIPIEVALSGFMMKQKPELTWSYISEIEKACRGAKHNRAHRIIVEMERHFDRVCVLTQNVDGFHRQAGSQNLVDIHGDIHTIYCPKCSHTIPGAIYAEIDIPPKCPDCSRIMRPDVVLFGEYLKPGKTAKLRRELKKGFDIVFSVGTTSVFPYISGPVVEAAANNIPTVEINPTATEVSRHVSFKFPYGAVKVLEDIWERLDKID